MRLRRGFRAEGAEKTGVRGVLIVAHPPKYYNSPLMAGQINLTHHFLIAMPAMADPNFAHTLTYVCEHNKDGALGIVVNKPIDMTLSALFEQIKVPLADRALREAPVHFGGPLQMRLCPAPASGQLAIDTRHRRRYGPDDVEGRARGRRPR